MSDEKPDMTHRNPADEIAAVLLEDARDKIKALEAALATAREDALREAAHIMPRYHGVWSSTGVHVGVWGDGATAAKVLTEYPDGISRDLIDMNHILDLIDKGPKK